LKLANVGASLTIRGSALHNLGAATEKALSPPYILTYREAAEE